MPPRSEGIPTRLGSGALLLPGLGITQTIGWGSTFYLPVVLAPALVADLGISEPLVYGGVTLMLLVSAAAAGVAGDLMSRIGPRRVMMGGSLLLALGCAALALATGPASYLAAWALFGLGGPAALSQGAATAVQQRFPGSSRRMLGALSIITAVAPMAAYPALALLDASIGWRPLLAILAAAHLVLCLPLHGALAPAKLTRVATASSLSAATRPAGRERHVLALFSAAFALSSLVTWGLALHIVTAARGLGHGTEVALAAGALAGPVQILGRVADGVVAARVGLPLAGAVALGLMALGLVTAASIGDVPAGLAAFVALYGLGAGVLGIVRSALPAELLGPERFAAVYGRMARWQNLAFAAGPVVVAWALTAFGAAGGLWAATAVIAVALAAFLRAWWVLRDP